MTQKTAQHYWGRFKKKGTRTTRMSSGFLQKTWMMGKTSIWLLEEDPRKDFM